ncbi:MAG: tRNA (cytidine(56)-2'-O)-methyltransferase [Candidatus Diapherotrites archaeon]|nr:tRNA (cytidine(56)-2'-O)-methyltransferase [Candidatus Diapherotrites archaeon]
MKDVVVIRYGHRPERDKRTTTHCALVARAFGAKKIVICSERDDKLEKNIHKVVQKWGGQFKISFCNNWKTLCNKLKEDGYKIVHLTMYGVSIDKKIKKIRKNKKIAVFVGSQKVPGEIYNLANFNISITNQPHSEIAALAIFLDRLFRGKQIEKEFSNAKIKIIPSENKKKIKVNTIV